MFPDPGLWLQHAKSFLFLAGLVLPRLVQATDCYLARFGAGKNRLLDRVFATRVRVVRTLHGKELLDWP